MPAIRVDSRVNEKDPPLALKVQLEINLLPTDWRPSGFEEVMNEGSGRFVGDQGYRKEERIVVEWEEKLYPRRACSLFIMQWLAFLAIVV